MVVLSVFILFIIFESSKLLSNAVNTYCSLPCPFMCPAQQPRNYGAIQLYPRRPTLIGRSSNYDTDADYDETPESEPPPPPVPRSRQEQPTGPDPPTSPSPQPKPKPKPPPAEDEEPPPKKKNSSSPSSPSIQPSRRFFTSLFSIPGAVVDTLIGGEITL